MFRGGKPSQRYIPGQAVPGAPGAQAAEEKKKRVRSKRYPKEAGGEAVTNGAEEAPVEEMKSVQIATPEADDAAAKKIRNLNKKVGSTTSQLDSASGYTY